MFRHFLAPLVWALIILFLSCIPSSELPDFSFWKLLSFDKFAHAGVYALLTFLVLKACVHRNSDVFLRNNAIKVTVISTLIYGGLIEIFQEYALIDRHGDWLDLIANIVGILAGIIFSRIIFSLKKAG